MSATTCGTLTAADLGQQFRIEWEGWVHTGALAFAKHEMAYRGSAQTFLALTSESSARWMKHVPSDHPIERQEAGR